MKRCPAALLFILPVLLVCSPLRAAERVELPASYLDQLVARPIGPANPGGRVAAIAVVEGKPSTLYVAAASGGLWKTVNNGTTWTPVFEREATVSLGEVAVSKSNPDVVWVGTGEANARNSVSWGDGVYKSTDGGKTWKNMGLRDSEHIGRVVLHPKNPDVVYVAALGHLWGPNKERGIYKTTDGGETWKAVKQIDADTGFIDLAMAPDDPETLYAAAYRVRRDAFDGGNPATQFGADAGLYKTTDGGKTWTRLTRGLPDRPCGRCGIDVSRKDPNVVYAVVQTDRTDTSAMPGQPARTGERVETGGVFRSTDRGESWVKVNDLCPRPFYFGQVRVDPIDDQRVYVAGVTLFVSADGGKTFRPDAAPETHADHHALWIDPADPQHLIMGTDGGVYFSYDRGARCEHVQNLPIGQFYGIACDQRKPYRVFGGLQDNGSWGGPSRTFSREGITLADWFRVLSADGYQCQCDPADPDTVYAESQWGGLRRIDLHAGSAADIKPRPDKRDDSAYRFNWSSPILVSPHNAKTVYFGGNHVFKSVNRGDIWETISPDLTKGEPGPNKYAGHTITTLAESPVKAGVLWAGTDDGNLQVSKNGGRDWTDVSAKVPSVPADRWITRVECSPFAEGTAFVTIDRHRNDDRAPYVFMTDDYGATWKSIAANLPAQGPAHVIRADSRNRDLLYLGTEFGLFVSVNAGASWQPVHGGLPTVAVHDLVVHPRDRDLVIATHGRSIYIMDVAPLQEVNAKTLAAPAYLFDVKPATAYQTRGAHGLGQGKNYLAPNPPFGATVYFALKEKPTEPVVVTITDALGKTVAELKGTTDAGLQKVQWGLRAGGRQEGFVPAGDYVARLKVGDQTLQKKFRVESGE
jgi:photosystem II stability/assembly factor-like uncharacterized protein